MGNQEQLPEIQSSLEHLGRAVAQLQESFTLSLRPFIEAHEQVRRNLTIPLESIRETHLRMTESLRPINEMAARVAETLRPIIEMNIRLQEQMKPLNEMVARALAGLNVFRQAGEMAVRASESLVALGEINSRIAEQMKLFAEGIQALVEREARARGLTTEEFMEALQTSDEIIEDREELEKLQEIVAWNLYAAGEISFVRLFQALPPEVRPLPTERSGIADDDFQPLVSGITRKE